MSKGQWQVDVRRRRQRVATTACSRPTALAMSPRWMPRTKRHRWKQRPDGPLRRRRWPLARSMMSQGQSGAALNQADGAGGVAGKRHAGSDSPCSASPRPFWGQGTVIAGFSSQRNCRLSLRKRPPDLGDALSRTSIATSVATLTDIDADPVIDRDRVFAIGQGAVAWHPMNW